MDERVRYKLLDRAFRNRAHLLSRLDDASEQRREIGIVAAALESATNDNNWALAEKLVSVLIKLRESQQKSRERAGELVDVAEFKRTVLEPAITCITARIQEAVGDGYEETIDKICDDFSRINPRLQTHALLEDSRDE